MRWIVPVTFQSIFKSDNVARDKFLSWLFGIFNEEIARCWSKDDKASYEDLGRPTVKLKDSSERGRTLDFTLRSKTDGQVYIAEMKCWLEYRNYRFLPLKEPKQLAEADNPAFRLFLKGAKEPSQVAVTVGGKPRLIDGSALIWCACSEQVRADTKAAYGLRDILSLEYIIADLVAWKNQGFFQLINDRQKWAERLFSWLPQVNL